MKYVYMHGTAVKYPVSNIFCIGRNYVDHIAELGNQQESSPIVFLKPTSSLNAEENVIKLPDFSNNIHYETELVLLIGKSGKHIHPNDAYNYIEGFAVGLDLTARDLQTQAKEKGLPWTIAKGFDYAACVSTFIAKDELNIKQCRFTMKLNNVNRQEGDPSLMIFQIPNIIAYLSTVFTLSAGDLVYTGTPGGVGPLKKGDALEIEMINHVKKEYLVM